MTENFWSIDIKDVAGWLVVIIGAIVFVVRYGGGLQARILVLETRMSLFWSVMEQHAATILHHPTMFERDRLIDGYLAGTLEPEQLQEFMHLLEGVVQDNTQASGERLAASFLLLAIHHRHGLAVGVVQ